MNAINSDLTSLLTGGAISPPASADGAPSVTVAADTGGVAFDASSKLNNVANWSPPLRSADAEMLPEKRTIDARSRDVLRNDAYVAGGSAITKDSIVGERFQLNARPMSKVLFGTLDEAWETEAQEEIEDKFSLYAESEDCWSDGQHVKTLTEQVRLAVGVDLAGGEILLSGEWMPADGRPYRSAVLFIDTDRLCNPMNGGLANQPNIRGGVERDKRGAPIAYHIRSSHPSDARFNQNLVDLNTWRRVPRKKPWGRRMMLHIFEQMRPDQSRGISRMVAALTEMRMMKKFRETEIQRAVIAATYAASIESDLPDDAVAALGGSAANAENATVQWVTDYLEAVSQYSGGAQNLHMQGAAIPVFMPGTHLKIQNPGAASPAGDKFEQSLLRHVAAILDVSYEELSRDYTQTNYSSARAAMGQTWRGMQSRKRRVADKTANFIYRLWLEEAINYNTLECMKRRNMPFFYDGQNADAYAKCDWIGAGRGMLDPLKETQAAILALKGGISTQEQVIASFHGGDWRHFKRQQKRELEMDREMGLLSPYEQPLDQNQQNALTAAPSDGGSQ